MDLKEFLEKNDYLINSSNNIVAKNSCLGYGWGVNVGILKKNIPVIYYNLGEDEQIASALKLRDLFDKNKIEYDEKPKSLFVAKKLRASVKFVSSLADRLERKV